MREYQRAHPADSLEDTITLTATTRELVLPSFVDSVLSVLNVSAGYPVVRESYFDRSFPHLESQGTGGPVLAYDRLGSVPTTRDPASHIFFSSSHASDVASVSVRGLTTNTAASDSLRSVISTLTVAATGTTPVTLTTLFTRILSISKATETLGDYTFTDTAPLSVIPAAEVEAAFQRLRLHYTPATPVALSVRFRHKLPPLTSSSDSPPPNIPSDFIISHALSLYWAEAEQFSKASYAHQAARAVLDDVATHDSLQSESGEQLTPRLFQDPDYTSRW